MGRERHGSGASRVRLAAGCAAALAALVFLLPIATAGPAGAATVTCPTTPLLAEEIEQAGSVFVGQVRGSAAQDATDLIAAETFAVIVEEIWHGPALASVVRVANPDHAGAPRIVLEIGGRYLFLAEPTTELSDAPIDRLTLAACSLTRPISPDLAGLRPADARVMPGFSPTDAAAEVPAWPWALAAVLVAIAAVAHLGRARLEPRWTWVPWAATAATVAALGLGVVLALAPPPDTAIGSPSPRSTPPFEPSTAASASAPAPSPGLEDPTLVARIRDSGTTMGTLGQVVSVHADGRVISAQGASRAELHQRRLNDTGVTAIRDAIEATGLFGGGGPATATYEASLRPGAQPPGRGAYMETLVAGVDGATASVAWTPILPGEVDIWQPSAEIGHLDELADLLWHLSDRLPAAAWADAAPDRYEALRFRVTDDELALVGYAPPTSLDEVDWPLDTPLSELPATRTPVGLLSRCVSLTRSEATAFIGSISAATGDPTLRLGRISVELAGEAPVVHRLTVEPLLPDESGCESPAPAPAASTLAPGAVALVRVDGLRMREGPGAEFAATDALRAGERVVVASSSTAADGSAWWLVRQGPGDRQGWVNAGPADGDPWLVPIANGMIAFLESTERVRTATAEGADPTTIADAGLAAWSPDGTRILLSVPPGADNPVWTIAVANPDGSGLRRLAEGDGGAWSPDGSRIAFVRYDGDDPGDGPSVYVMRADGSAPERVAMGVHPAWSPDGSSLVMWRPDLDVRPPSGDGVVPIPEALWVVDLESGSERQITPYEVRESSGGGLAWSPDGTLIAADVRLLDPEGTEVLRLDPGDTWSERPWSPDGEDLIVVDTDREDNARVGVSLLAVDSGDLRAVVPAGVESLSHVTWSPDGRYLAFTAVRWTVDGNIASLGIRTVPAAGGETTDLGVTDSQFPDWQPLVSVPLD